MQNTRYGCLVIASEHCERGNLINTQQKTASPIGDGGYIIFRRELQLLDIHDAVHHGVDGQATDGFRANFLDYVAAVEDDRGG